MISCAASGVVVRLIPLIGTLIADWSTSVFLVSWWTIIPLRSCKLRIPSERWLTLSWDRPPCKFEWDWEKALSRSFLWMRKSSESSLIGLTCVFCSSGKCSSRSNSSSLSYPPSLVVSLPTFSVALKGEADTSLAFPIMLSLNLAPLVISSSPSRAYSGLGGLSRSPLKQLIEAFKLYSSSARTCWSV